MSELGSSRHHIEEAEEPAFEASVFATNPNRFPEGKVAEGFLTQVVELARNVG